LEIKIKKVLVIGGSGYLGCVLVPYLLSKDYKIKVLDLMIYGNNLKSHKNLQVIRGDLRDVNIIKKVLIGMDAVIHLACISNDPSFELNPKVGKSINFTSFEPIVYLAKKLNIKRFIYASSSSVYGVKKVKNVTEESSLKPLTDYSKYKAKCEKILNSYSDDNFLVTSVRSATLCGFSMRQRLDLIVNIFCNLAHNRRSISVYGGNQLRPNIHIKDTARFYELLLYAPFKVINKQAFNIGYKNYSVMEIAKKVVKIFGKNIVIKKFPTNDKRSYHISSAKAYRRLKFRCRYSIDDAIVELKKSFENKLLRNTLKNPKFYNINVMKNYKFKKIIYRNKSLR